MYFPFPHLIYHSLQVLHTKFSSLSPTLNSFWFLTIYHLRTRTLVLHTNNVEYFQQLVCQENCLGDQNTQLIWHMWYIRAESHNSNTDSISKVMFHLMAAWAGWNVLLCIVFFSHCDGSVTILHCAVKNENSEVFDTDGKVIYSPSKKCYSLIVFAEVEAFTSWDSFIVFYFL